MQKLRKNPLLFPALVVLRSIVMVLYSAPELLMIQQVNYVFTLSSVLLLFEILFFQDTYPLFRGFDILYFKVELYCVVS